MRYLRIKYCLLLLIPILPSSCRDELVELPGDDDLEFTIEEVSELPGQLAEASGIIFFNEKLWSINDSGNEPEVISFDTANGNIDNILLLTNATNTDWEDIAQDKNRIFIGDFGNNAGDRTDLVIYIIDKSEITNQEYQEITATNIRFSYEDQTDFTPGQHTTEFDCEAMIHFNGSLYLFTKNWLTGSSVVYTLPDTPGEFVATRIDEFDSQGLVTGVDIDLSDNKMAFCGYSGYMPFVILFNDMETVSFDGKGSFRLELDEYFGTQIEGVSFVNKSIYLVSEATTINGPALFRISFE
ncbi:MAG: hypothetical protein JW894_13970 [Bacteroidales bacterium]|nr:hypothetical protein [Bacteroidales bacterium]